MRLTDDDLVTEEREGDELGGRPYSMSILSCLSVQEWERQRWAESWARVEPFMRAEDEAAFRAHRTPAYALLPVAWNDGDPLPAGFDPGTNRPYHYLFWRDMPAGWQRGDALPDWCDNKPILASPRS